MTNAEKTLGMDVLGTGAPVRRAATGGPDRPLSISRIPGIDGLRALAILIVMVSHAGLGRYVPGGFGVTIFFFLSGYLITTLLRVEYSRSGRINLPAFYMRRVLRILPPLYLTMTLVVVLALTAVIDTRVTPLNLVTDALFLTNYAGLLGLPSTTPIPLWSLDVEEHFYMLFPACFAALAMWRGSRIARALGAICLLTLLIRIATFAAIGEGEIYYWSHTRIDSIIFGAVLAVWQNPMLDEDAWRPRPWHVALALLVIALTLALRAPAFRETLRYTLQGGALFVLFSAAIQARGPVARLLAQRWLRVVALFSYTLYLVHMPMLEAMRPLGLWSVPVAYVLAFAWAAGMYACVERPLARRRQRSLRKVVQEA